MRVLLAVTFFLHCVGKHTGWAVSQECLSQPTCSECIRTPGCAWCKYMDFLETGEPNERHCDSEAVLRSRGCRPEDVVYPRSETDTKKNKELQGDLHNVVQLKPQNLHVRLRVGEPHTFQVSFKRVEGYPIDLYYLMDLSYSMKDDLEKIKTLSQDILSSLKTKSKQVRIGFGSFVDKVALPYVSMVKAKKSNPCPSPMFECQPAFSFQNVLGLTSNADTFKRRVNGQRISGNLDSPESGLDAIMQAAVCQEAIKWGNVTRILVYTSDDTFHMAGDGRLAGIVEPHDGKCHLDDKGFYSETIKDYPSVGHLSRVLSANNIQLIFAVTDNIVPAYKALSELIPQSVVGELKNDSSNVVQLISEAYNNLSSTILLEHQRAPPDLDVSYSSRCTPGGGQGHWQRRGECRNIRHQQVDFTVRLKASTCLEKAETFVIKVQGISEELQVTVETLCDCNCGPTEEHSPRCNRHGLLSCGMCSCSDGHLGQRCECDGQSDMAACRQCNSSVPCSGHGSCECGSCVCTGSFRGKFCECDDSSCDRHQNMICGGNGKCKCGACECDSNHTGPACGCSRLLDGCRTRDTLCSGQGTCVCNECRCKAAFIGEHCSKLSNPCPDSYRDCVKCLVSETGPQNCSAQCDGLRPERVSPQQFQCPVKDFNFNYKVDFTVDGKITVHYAEIPGTINKTHVIIGSAVSGIIFIGIAIILVYRLLVELYDMREYRSFLKAQEQTDWKDMRNPLFQDATTTVLNPMHIQES